MLLLMLLKFCKIVLLSSFSITNKRSCKIYSIYIDICMVISCLKSQKIVLFLHISTMNLL